MNESQYVLRLPQPLVEPMRLALSSQKRRDAAGDEKKSSSFKVHFKDERNAVFSIDGNDYPASLMDLPCLVETHKTADKRTFYKSGDLHQMLVVRMPDDPAPTSFQMQNGLTRASKHAAKRLAKPPKVFTPDDIHRMEQRIKYVMDHKINLVSKKNEPQPPEEEVVIEEEPAVNPAPAKPPPTPSSQPTPPPSKPVDNTSLPPTPADTFPTPRPSPMPDTPAADTPQPYTPGPFTPTPMTPVPVSTPLPDTADEDEDGDEDMWDDENFDDMADALAQEDQETVLKRRIEASNLEAKIKKIEEDLQNLDTKASKAPNPILRNRLLSKRPPLEKELEDAQARLKELNSQL